MIQKQQKIANELYNLMDGCINKYGIYFFFLTFILSFSHDFII